MSEFTFLLGEPALSEFRKRKLLHRIRAAAGGDIGLEAHWVYLVEAQTTLAPSDIEALQELLHGRHETRLDPDGLLLVVPRLGTQSPWSTKATDIARSMVKEYGMSSKVGKVYFAREKRSPFLDMGMEGRGEYSDSTAELIDHEVRNIINEQYEKALEISKNVLGEEHPDTATTLRNLGALLQDMGDFVGDQGPAVDGRTDLGQGRSGQEEGQQELLLQHSM